MRPDRKPRIAFVDLTFNWPPVGGCWVDFKEICARLSGRGFETKLFTPLWTDYYPRGHIEGDLPFPVERIPFSRFTFNAYHVRKRFGRAVEAWKPDFVFLGDGYHLKPHLLDHFSRRFPTYCRFYAYDVNCLNLHYWLYSEGRVCDGGFLTDPDRCHRCWHPGNSFIKRAAKIALGRPDNHPQLHFSQEYMSSLAFTRWYRRNLPKWLASAEGLVVYNDFTANFFRPLTDRIHIIPSGIDSSRFQPRPPDAGKRRRILFVPGRVNDELKGFSTVHAACRKLREEGFDFEVRITAAFDMHFEEEWIKNLGWIPQDRVPDLYREVDVAIVPSLWVEPFGITTLEAMASGVPVVGARIGGIAETLVDGETGLHFPSGDAEGLAACLRKLLASPELGAQLGEAGRRRAVEVYDWERVIDRWYLRLFGG